MGFLATSGYDQATGWGSIDSNNFVEQWSGDITLSASQLSLNVPPGTSAASTITVAPQNNFTGDVKLTCSVSSGLIDVTCSIPSTPIRTSGSAVVTISATRDAGVYRPARFPQTPLFHSRQMPVVLFLVPGIAILLLLRRFARPVGVSISIGIAAASIAAIVLVSCGGGAAGGSKVTPTPLALACSVPNAITQTPYNGSCTASGGVPPYTYAVGAGSFFPTGLTLNSSTEAITGTPTVPSGAIDISFSVSDSSSPAQQATQSVKNFQLFGPLSFSCAIQPNWTAGVSVPNQPCSINGGEYPITVSVATGAVPPGIAIDPKTGAFSGFSTKAGAYAFTLKATDSFQPPQTATQAASVNVSAATPLSIRLPTVSGPANVYLSQPITVAGGIPPYSYLVTGGSLPAGLTVGPNPYIYGTPKTQGTSTYTLTVQDSDSPQRSASTSGTAIISPPPPESGTVTVTATSGGIVNTLTLSVSVPAPTASGS